MALVAEIIAVGTELLLGNTANTDAQDVSQVLSELGIHCYFHTTVGDNDGRVKQAIEIAKGRADIIITTGGLGPTYDDMTKQTVCEAFHTPLVLHEPSWQRIVDYFKKINRPLTNNNRQQAMLPEGCTIMQNDWGTAPGCAFEADGKHILMLPGPPHECRAMLKNCAMPYLAKLCGQTIVSRKVKIFGMGESQVEDLVADYIKNAANPTIAPYAKDGECFLRVTASAENHDTAFAITEPAVKRLQEILGDVVYGIDVETLEEVVLELLKKHGKTLAVAESCTGGMLASRITSLSGSSQVFLGGAVTYTNKMKNVLLGVPLELLKKHGAVSRPVAEEMARGICTVTGADFGIGITGLAGPQGDGSDNPVGTVHIALFERQTGEISHIEGVFGDERRRIRTMSSSTALNMLRKKLTI